MSLRKNLKEIHSEMLIIAKEINDFAASDLIQDIACTFQDHMLANLSEATPEYYDLADTLLDTKLFARLHLKWIIQESRRLYDKQHQDKNLVVRLLQTYNYYSDNNTFDLIESHLTKAA